MTGHKDKDKDKERQDKQKEAELNDIIKKVKNNKTYFELP